MLPLTLLRRFVTGALIACPLLMALCYWRSDALPTPDYLKPQLFEWPAQTPTSAAPFTRTVGDIAYTITPLFDYDISGLVVSEHDSHDFTDWYHRASHDTLNIKDICLVWAQDARSGVYRQVEFWSGNFTCNFQYSGDVADRFDIFQVSNNHLLTETHYLGDVLRSIHVGDEVHLRGYLARYEHDHGFHYSRTSSITRFDTGDGACEVIYVTDARILRSHGRLWRVGFWLAAAGLLAAGLAWLLLPTKMLR